MRPGDGRQDRYHRIVHDPEALQALLTEMFIESWPGRLPPSRLVLDIDSTDDAAHGRQEGSCYHGYYRHYCFLPLCIFCGAHPLCAVLRPGNADPAAGAVQRLARIVARLRRRWPGLPDPLARSVAGAWTSTGGRIRVVSWGHGIGVSDSCILAMDHKLTPTVVFLESLWRDRSQPPESQSMHSPDPILA